MATAADVPNKYDVVIDGQGYVFDDSIDPSSVYSSRQRAQFGLSPVFVERQNVQGDYGDNQQEFFPTFTQRDWSLGEQQRYARPNDVDSARRYWLGSKIDITRQGKVSMRDDTLAITAAAAIKGMCDNQDGVWYATSTNLYQVGAAGGLTDRGAHGLGTSPKPFGMIDDDFSIFLTSTAVGSVGVRRYDGAFSTFSANGADALAYLNNTLYGFASGVLYKWDTAGVQSTVYTWKGAQGSTLILADGRLAAFGGKLLILLTRGGTNRSELWQYDGTAPSMLAALPSTFEAWDMDILAGTVFISGRHILGGASTRYRPAIYYYTNGTLGLLWQSDTVTTSSVYTAISDFGNGLVFTDDVTGKLMFYDAAAGGFHSIGAYTVAGDTPRLSSSFYNVTHSRNQVTGYVFPGTAVAASATITTSLVDFDSSLTKNFHGVRVEFDSASDGDGGSVDVAYRVGDVDGSYTSLATGVASGTEIAFSGVSGKSISIRVTLNKGTSTSGPVLKRISIRTSLVQPQYLRNAYTLACYGTDKAPEDGSRRVKLRDGTYHPKTGLQMIADLKTAAGRTAPITITDEVSGTYTGVIEPDAVNIDRIHVGEFRVQLQTRSV